MRGELVEIGVRLHDVPGESIEERLHEAARLGFRSVHLASKLLYQAWGCREEGLTEERAKRLKEVLEQEGLSVAVFGCYKNLATPDAAEEKANLKEFVASARFARWIGAGVVGSETGRPNKEKRIGDDRFSGAALEALVRQAREAAAGVSDEGSRLALEPGWNEVCCTPERAAAALEGIAREDVGIILDPVSLLHPKVLPEAQTLTERALRLLGNRIEVLHAKDYSVVDDEEKDGWCDGSGSRLVCHGAGASGSYDMGTCMRWTLSQKRPIPVIVENGTPETFATSLQVLEAMKQD